MAGSRRPMATDSIEQLGARKDDLTPTFSPRQPEEVVHAVGLAPGHDRLAAEPAVAADQDLDLGPIPADPPDDPLQLLQGPGRGVDVGGPQLGAEQLIAAEVVQGS